MSKLFSPYTLGNLALKNRTVMAPMTRSRAINNTPNELVAEYYGQRAGAGFIITEGTSPSPNGVGYPRIPGIWNKAQIEGWKLVTEAVHKNDGKIFVQLMHTGRVTHPDNLPEGAEALAPSAVKLETTKLWVDAKGSSVEVPVAKVMTKEDVQHAINEHIQAAKNAIEAGFDGVEIHGANGYLVKQFLSPVTNKRTDEYGGSIENRSRFLLDVAKGIIEAIGKDKVGVRLSPYGVHNEMPHYPEADATYDHVSKKLNELGIVYLHLVDHSSIGAPAVPESIVKTIRNNFKGNLILSGNYNKERAEAVLESGDADLVAFGRPFLGNPDLVERLKNNLPLNQLRFDLFYTAAAEGYTDYQVYQNAVLAQ
ncbi:MAG TPA: alkene reductase [Cyclobacteriaceae bacterium]|jgi:N-ethylmaleimide reductase|nr:alkene reductase [Cyclobacteriaceae bacterium]